MSECYHTNEVCRIPRTGICAAITARCESVATKTTVTRMKVRIVSKAQALTGWMPVLSRFEAPIAARKPLPFVCVCISYVAIDGVTIKDLLLVSNQWV